MARKWTSEQKAAQSAKIKQWQPWLHSTGPVTSAGKAISSRNSYKGAIRPLKRLTARLEKVLGNLGSQKANSIIDEMKRLSASR